MSLQGTVTIRPFRDMRMTSPGISAGRVMPLLADSSGFARSIADRYSLSQTLWANSALRVRRKGLEGSVQSFQHHLHVNIMPRLNFTAIHLRTLPPGPAEGGVFSGPLIEKTLLLQLGREIPLVPMEDLLRRNLVQRLVTRGERVEELIRQSRTSFQVLDAVGAVRRSEPEQTISFSRPAQNVVRRTPLAKPDSARPSRPADNEFGGFWGRQRETVTPSLPQTAALDINRLTEQVIQAIDRRIIAQRERLGKV